MIWDKYEKCNQYLDEISLVNRTNEQWDFYFGNQWQVGYNRTLNTGGVNLPDDNFITSTIKFHTSTVAQNHFMPTFNDTSGDERKAQNAVTMNKLFQKERDLGKQRSRTWEIIKSGFIQGDSYQYCGTDNPKDHQVHARPTKLDEILPKASQQVESFVRCLLH